MSFLLSIEEENPHLASLLLPNDDESEPHAFVEHGKLRLPELSYDTPVLAPKTYRDGGARIGDRGTLNFIASQGTFSVEQKIPIRVVGFYDPGIMSVGNKCLLVPSSITRLIHASTQTFSPDGTPTNGLFVWIDDFSKAKAFSNEIEKRLEHAKIAKYWKVSTYEDFEFSKDLMIQFKSDRTLFLIIASIILIVACCNIISLLVLLVNDKKKEIAILQSMGASFSSIAAIFGACGMAMGTLSCLFGSLAAVLTLHHIDGLVSILSALQGRAAFNPAFFGQSLPNQLSFEALLFVLIATPLLSFAAGIIPALKASRIKTADALRSE
jgi:lipoprotein-releasing system permease protein